MYTLTQEEIIKYKKKDMSFTDIKELINIIYNINYENFINIMRQMGYFTYKNMMQIWYGKLAKSCYKCNKFFKICETNDVMIYKCNICEIKYNFTKKEITEEVIEKDLYEFIKNS